MKTMVVASLIVGLLVHPAQAASQQLPGEGGGNGPLCDAACGFVPTEAPWGGHWECFTGGGAVTGYNDCYIPAPLGYSGYCEGSSPCTAALPLSHPDGMLREAGCDELGGGELTRLLRTRRFAAFDSQQLFRVPTAGLDLTVDPASASPATLLEFLNV